MGRPGFKPGEGRQTSLVGSTPTLFRHSGPARTLSQKFSQRCRVGLGLLHVGQVTGGRELDELGAA